MSSPERFQVDLGGLVDLLSTHLYSGPSVYVRELLQNAVDAIAARRLLDPAAPAQVRLEADGTALTITDTGVGLGANEAKELLSTIASSSKRDALLGGGRAEFMGQFGIGLLSAFMVAEEVEILSLAAAPGATPVRWVGRADGTFTVEELPEGALPEIGTRLRLVARPGSGHWLEHETVLALVREYGSLLPVDISMEVEVPGVGPRRRRLIEPAPVWQRAFPSAAARTAALEEHCRDLLGFEPLAAIDLSAPAVGLTGVAYILPAAVAPGVGQSRVSLKRMLLGTQVPSVLPPWAFFVRAVLDADGLAPSASREQLREDELLAATRDVLGEQLLAWILAQVGAESPVGRRFLLTHHLALRAIAVENRDILRLVARSLPFETTAGHLTLAELAQDGPLAYTATTEAYRSVEAVARAQGIAVVNAGYAYDAELLAALDGVDGISTRPFDVSSLSETMDLPDAERELRTAPAIARARSILEPADCDVILRRFTPASCPAVLLRDADGERRRDLDREREAAPDLWGGLLDSLADGGSARTRTLALNDTSPVIQALLAGASGGDPEVFTAGVSAVYATAILSSGEPLRRSESTALNSALTVLLSHGLGSTEAPPAAPPKEAP